MYTSNVSQLNLSQIDEGSTEIDFLLSLYPPKTLSVIFSKYIFQNSYSFQQILINFAGLARVYFRLLTAKLV